MRHNHKIGVMMCAFREEKNIVPAIRQFDGTDIEEIVVACSRTSWKGEKKCDKTAEIAVRAGATVRLFDWEDEKDQKNWILSKFRDFDWIIMSAPDMYLTRESINNLAYYLNGKSMDEHNRGYSCDMVTYWKDCETIIEPRSPFNTVVIRPGEVFSNSATLERWEIFDPLPGVLMHHLSWVKTDEEVLNKIKTYSHADEINPAWYRNIWLNWSPGMIDFGPTEPKNMHSTTSFSLPQEIRDLLNKYQRNENKAIK